VVRYGPVTAVDGVSLEVAPGEVIALLGGSGSGKSSLLRAIAGLEPLVSGAVAWDGEDLAGVPPHRRGFGMMFQDGQLFPHLSVAANVAYGLFSQPRARRRQRAEELLALVGLAGYGNRPVTALSGGEAQRVALARSLAPVPRLLLLDEPLSALDRSLRESLVTELGDGLRRTGTTGIYVTHDQDEAFAIADRVGVMQAGRLLQLDPPDVLWSHPCSREVAEFIGYGPFVDPAIARGLGWDVPGGAGLVGIGPVGLVHAAAGIDLPVIDQQYRRGYVEIEVVLPDGQRATVRTGEKVPGSSIALRLDPEGCVLVG
jgi:thiamine transport system ATP-binding protein